MANWQNRIVSSGEEAPDQLIPNPLNWRIHPEEQQKHLETVMDTVGWVQRVIVNKQTGRVVDGHLRVALAVSRNETSVPVDYIDVSEEEERLILASFDWLTMLATPNTENMAALLNEIDMGDEIDGLLESITNEFELDLAGVTFKEYDESIADEVTMVECPECGHSFPK